MANFFRKGYLRVIIFSFMTVVLLTECRAENNERSQENAVIAEKKEEGKVEISSKKKLVGMEYIKTEQKIIKDEFTEIDNVIFNEEGISLKNPAAKGSLISKSYNIPLKNPEPYGAITFAWYGTEKIILKYRVSLNNKDWNEWKNLLIDSEYYDVNKKNRHISDYSMFEKNMKYFQYMLILESGNINKVEVSIFSPGIQINE